jgi:hypothetical protein
MKKAWLFLIVVAMLVLSVPVFAQTMAAPAPTVKFSMLGFWWANVDPNITQAGGNVAMNGGYKRVWPTADIAFDPNNTLEIGLRFHSDAVTDVIDHDNAGGEATMDLADSLWHFMWTSDLTGAMGLKDSPVDVKVTIGQLDSVMTNWWYDNNGWEWEYGGWSKVPGTNWDAGLITINEDSDFLGYSLSVGFGPVILHWVNDFSLQDTLVGAEASYMGFGAFVSYGQYGPLGGYGGSTNNFAIEAKWDSPKFGDFSLTPSLFYREAASPANWVFGGDLSLNYQMFKLVVGATTTSTYSLEHYSATLWITPVDAAQLWIAAYLDGATPDNAPLQAVDIGATYKFGAFKAIVGWVIGGADQTAGNSTGTKDGANPVTLGNDNVGGIYNGLYFGSAINF